MTRDARYYPAVAAFCRRQLEAAARRPMFLGISGPQGSGKSTLAAELVSTLAVAGVRAVAVSIDDFYWTRAEQLALAARFPGNACLAVRGYPGTHDVAIGRATLDSLAAGRSTRIPSYDKSAHGGRGDRAPESAFRSVEGPVDCVIVEGWMLGFRPVEPAGLPPDLRAPNEALAAYGAWHERLDAFVLLQASSLGDIVDWRVDSERARRALGQGALSDAEAREYIETFLPAYEAYLPGLYARPPGGATLEIRLAADRSAVSIRER